MSTFAVIQSDAQQILARIDQAVTDAGNIAHQIESATRQAHEAINTPIAITTPTPSRAGTIGWAMPTEIKVALVVIGFIVLLALLKK